MLRFWLCGYVTLALLAFMIQHTEGGFTAVLSVVSGIISLISFIIQVVTMIPSKQEISQTVPFSTQQFQSLLQLDISGELTMIESKLENIISELNFAINRIPELVSINNKLYEISLDIGWIYNKYEKYIHMSNNHDHYTDEDRAAFARAILSPSDNGLNYYLIRIYSTLFPHISGDVNTLDVLDKHFHDFEFICKVSKTPQMLWMEFFETILLTEVQGYHILQHAYKIEQDLRKHNLIKVNGNQEYDLEAFKIRTTRILSAFKKYVTNASRDIWTCDPLHYTKNDYTELKNLVRKSILYMRDQWMLVGNCTNVKYWYYSASLFPSDCKWPQADYGCEVVRNTCAIPNKYSELPTSVDFLDPESCSRVKQSPYEVKLHEFVESHCACNCDIPLIEKPRVLENSLVVKQIRWYLDASPVETTNDNTVITGVQFKSEEINNTDFNGVFLTIQIQQGQILKNGTINESSLEWLPVKKFNGKHVMELHESPKRFKLGTLKTSNGVLVGLMFSKKTSYIELIPLWKVFDFNTGRFNGDVIRNPGFDYSSDDAINDYFDLKDADVPTKTAKPSIPDASKTFVLLQSTSLKKNKGLSTIPYLDTQVVTSNPPVPLAGVALYYKGRSGYGGFLGLKLISYNFANHINFTAIKI